MFYPWIMLILLLSGGRAFMIHNTKRSLCLEDSASTGEVLLKKCNLDSLFQQWIWTDQGMLMCIATSRCLSAQQTKEIQTQTCQGPEVEAAALTWDCDMDRLVSRSTLMLLSADGHRPILSHVSKYSKWRSLDRGNICQVKLRLKRASDESDEFEAAQEQTEVQATMTEEEREYLRWYYRTEDPTTWNLVLLGVSFICLLVGFLLLGMGVMASKSRKKIAKYKAAASLTHKSEGEVLKIISPLIDDNCSKPPSSPSAHRLQQGNNFPMCDSEISEFQAGNIIVTWKDGSTSCLYADPSLQVEKQAEEQEEKQEGKQEEISATEPEDQDGVKTTK